MASKIPINLKGSNLGERHRYLNSLVTEAYKVGGPIEAILQSPETSPVDRLFKINLASKYKHTDYILKNLQDDDMLFVSRALKSTWLLEDQYRHIMNPDHLESALYPHMITTAVNKMKHWIHLNLRDPVRCLEFYNYYSTKETDYALKFLSKCPNETILSEFQKTMILENITPQRLKVLCEKTPGVAKLFYEMLTKDASLLKKYRQKEQEYFKKINCILKNDVDIFLDITELHFLSHFKRLSKISTKFIMSHRKDRFFQKPELYTARILNVNAVAQCLTPDECENLVIQLARAQYLTNERFFTYQNVEPFVKRLDFTKRASFKKKVFVEKDVGESILEWPYSVPEYINILSDDDIKGVFLEGNESNDYEDMVNRGGFAACMKLESLGACYLPRCPQKRTTLLDALFEEYRFSNFAKTLFELRKKIKSESSSQNRMYMFLVLVSKSGGRSENLDALFHLLIDFKNEPSQVRAAVIRSLVKRSSVWRVTEDNWKSLLVFGRGLGLDGNVPEADCIEGLHAVVIRALLSNRDIEPPIKFAFVKNFSTFKDYSLTKAEKEHLIEVLFRMLIEGASAEANATIGAQFLEYAIDVLQAYNIKFQTHPELTATIKKLLKNDPSSVKCLLERLFRSKLGRKELFRETFDLVQTGASYFNALKHDITILNVDKFLNVVIFDKLKADQFFSKMSIYFNHGNDDLASQFLIAIKKAKIHKNLARPITYLIGNDLKCYIQDLDSKSVEHKRFSAIVRANAHVARPPLNLNTFEWQKAGAKLISNKVLMCKTVDIDILIKNLLTWNKTARLAVILAQRTSYEADIFAAVAKLRPTITLKTALTYFRRKGDQTDLGVWEIVKPLIVRATSNPHLVRNVKNVNSIPLMILPEYLVETFKVINKIDSIQASSLLFHIKKNLSKVNEKYIEEILLNFVENTLVLDRLPKNNFNYEYDKIAELYLSILGKYLLLCKNEDYQNKRLNNIGQLYLDRLQSLWGFGKDKKRFFMYIAAISHSMRYTEVFMNGEYASCLPVMTKIVEWMRGFIPVEKHFEIYVPFHLDMLYYKTIRQAAEQVPGLFDDKQRRVEAYKIVGETFGRYVGQEARVMTKKYFNSIVLLYQVGLTDYFNRFNNEKYRVLPHFIKGIIDASDGIECTIALNMYKTTYNYGLQDDEKEEVLKCFKEKNTIEMQFFHENWPKIKRYHNHRPRY